MGEQRRIFVQKCWTCKYATDKDDCIWVRTLKKHYKGTKIDDEGYIIECPKYEKDKLLYTTKEKAKAIGVSIVTYCKTRVLLKQINSTMSVEEYIEYKRRKAKENKENHSSSDMYRIYRARAYLKRIGLNMSPEEWIKRQDEKKKQRNIFNSKYLRKKNAK